MSWQPVIVRRDKSMFNMFERPLVYHLAEKINEIEDKQGQSVIRSIVVDSSSQQIEVIVKLGGEPMQQNG
jgi:hypothetical protein